MPYVLALDQGTSSSRALLFRADGQIAGIRQQQIESRFPQPGWVEQDAIEIWITQRDVARALVAATGVDLTDVVALGITNQRETTVVWDRATSLPIHPAIVWQDRRTSGLVDDLRRDGLEPMIRQATGLVLDAYFSATKIAWILDNVPGARARAEAGELACGTIDCWLQWQLSAGAVHSTDATNASRTLLYDIHTGAWSGELLGALRVPAALLPAITDSVGIVGAATALFDTALPLAARIGDQQAATFGQAIVAPGTTKTTYGTGCFLLTHTGNTVVASSSGLLATVALQREGARSYALEGSVFVGGAAVQWLRDGLGLIDNSADVEPLAASVDDSGGVMFVPALTGLGAPHWDQRARGTITGLSRGTTRAHIARAALEGIAFQVADVAAALADDLGTPLAELRVDGAAAANDLLMQLQADLLGLPVVRPRLLETTAWGAGALAGLCVGLWPDFAALGALWQQERRFEPSITDSWRAARLADWQAAVAAARLPNPAGR